MFIAALLAIAKTWKKPKCPFTDCGTYIQQNTAAAKSRQSCPTLCDPIDGSPQIPYDTTYMQNLKYDTNEPIYKAETGSQTQGTDSWWPRGKGLGEGWSEKLGLVNVSYYIWDG